MEFKRINDTELVSVSEETNLLVEVNGEVKRTASTEHMKVEKLKNLITKFGGNSEDVQSVDEALDRLCACEIGGGVSSWNDMTDKPFGEVTETIIEKAMFQGEADYQITEIKLGQIPYENFVPMLNNSDEFEITVDGVTYTGVFEMNENAGNNIVFCKDGEVVPIQINRRDQNNDQEYFFMLDVGEYNDLACFSLLCPGSSYDDFFAEVEMKVKTVKTLDPKFVVVKPIVLTCDPVHIESETLPITDLEPLEIFNRLTNGENPMFRLVVDNSGTPLDFVYKPNVNSIRVIEDETGVFVNVFGEVGDYDVNFNIYVNDIAMDFRRKQGK